MRIHCFQHVAFEGLGSIENWITANKHSVTYTQFFKNDYTIPDINDFDLLIIMGGPMSVNDEKKYPWLIKEKSFLKEFFHQNKPAIGICLGSQLIANVLGSKVYKNRFKEIGWYPVFAKINNRSTYPFSESFHVFHWHGETFDIPVNAQHLAFSNACKNQAFVYKNNIVGLQFHLEITPETIRNLISNCNDELVEDKYIQKENELITYTNIYFEKANKIMEDILNRITKTSHSSQNNFRP